MRTQHLVAGIAGLVIACGIGSPAVAQEFQETLQRIKDRGTINIGHREASVPFAYIGEEGDEPIGYTIDICLNVVDRIEEVIGVDELEINWVAINPQTRIPLMANGTTDMECGSTTNNFTRQQQVDYAYTTYITGTRLLTKKDSGIENVEDLSGNVIALAQGTTNERVVKEAIEERDIEDVEVLSVADHDEGFLALQTDRVDAYSTDDILLAGLIEKARNPDDYHIVGDMLSFEPYAIMVPKNDSEFRRVVNMELAELFRSGEIYDIYDKWFPPMGVPLSDMLDYAFKVQAVPE
ncbi:amino acid ABC transporter substrate-binding protein [Spiribacter halobius]|uniref:Amino acid ABC transporter substrate-binding protein n=1 Tax=Sediminicurvatus halobius TaxID=2182432 RepID=A0A2U2MY50_9GAMM|nr:amino acid ABC transporter substrate-binding protein [Spiribacter halobius]PWG61649.1 amino acid ABC transporter substrate-binding protein [Spiribacter halobius]UEX79453.1 amino acid ABC transporter substrate-binding protein [Spiribacter halobius]